MTKYLSAFALPFLLGVLFWNGSTAESGGNIISKPLNVIVTSAEDKADFQQVAYTKAEWDSAKDKVSYSGVLAGKGKFSAHYRYAKDNNTLFISVRKEGSKKGVRLAVRENPKGGLSYRLFWNGQAVGAGASKGLSEGVYIKVANAKVLQTDEFHILQYLPHEMKGVSPPDLFEGDSGGQEAQAMGIFKKIGKWLGGIKLGGNCSKRKVTRYHCSQTCTQSPDLPPGECAGSMCGGICCCGSCTSEEIVERECGGEVSVGQ